MKRLAISTLFVVGIATLVSFNQDTKEKWVPLFNGKNLDGWTPKIVGQEPGKNFGNTFRVENGILSVRYDQYENNFNSRFGALHFNKKFKNFRLRAEYRFTGELTPGAPSWSLKTARSEAARVRERPHTSPPHSTIATRWSNTSMDVMERG